MLLGAEGEALTLAHPHLGGLAESVCLTPRMAGVICSLSPSFHCTMSDAPDNTGHLETGRAWWHQPQCDAHS